MTASPAWGLDSDPATLTALPRLPGLESSITPQWAWGGSDGRGVRVAIIDSGVDASHPALAGGVQASVAFVEDGEGVRPVEAAPEDLFGHGTACAGIVRSIAPGCEILSVRVLGSRLSGRGPVFSAAIRWALDHGVHVCNLSLGTTNRERTGVLHELADEAYFKNVTLVAAANNLPIPSYPSLFSSVVSVAAHAGRDPFGYYFNPNPPVEFWAPGVDLDVPWPGGGTVTASGNSYAAPHMTGIIARILGTHPGMTVFQLKTVLRSLAANVRPAREEAANGETVAL